MKKTLIVTAHPSSKGFTHQIAAAYKKGREAKGYQVEILDLYKTDLKQDYLTFEEKSDMSIVDDTKKAIQAKITESDDIVFVHPLWWVGTPAILKNFIDQNLSSRFAFRYIDGKPVGLLTGKTSSVFITCDGPLWLYVLIALPFMVIWRFAILQYCGLRVNTISVFDRKMFRSEAEQQKFLKKVEKKALKFK